MSLRFRFDDFLLNAKERQLLHKDSELKLQPKSFDVLLHLLMSAGNLVTKDELLDEVWSDSVVTPNSLTRCIKQIRAVLEDDANSPKYIETIQRSGYRFIGSVEVLDASDQTGVSAQTDNQQKFPYLLAIAVSIVAIVTLGFTFFPNQSGPKEPGDSLLVSDEVSIAILPFEDLSPRADQRFLAEGIADTITYSLSRVEGLVVTARTSAFSFRDENLTVPEIGQRLQVAYVLEGSIQLANETIQVIARLIESESGAEIWSGSFREVSQDIFTIQDGISADVAAAMQVNLLGIKESALQYRPQIEAFENFVLARAAEAVGTMDSYLDAREYYERAIEIDPNYAEAKIALARGFRPNTLTRDMPLRESISIRQELVDAAMRLDPTLSIAHTELGFLRRDQGDIAGSTESFEQAIELNRNNAEAYAGLGSNLFRSGQFQESLSMHEMAVRLAPRNNQFRIFLANAYWTLAQSERALSVINDNIENYPDRADNYSMLVRWLMQLGRGGEALYYQNVAREKDPSNSSLHFGMCENLYNLAADVRAQKCLIDYMNAQPNDANARWVFHYQNRDYETALEVLNEVATTATGSYQVAARYLMVLGSLGRWEELLTVARENMPDLFTSPPQVDAFSIWPATNVVHAFAQLNNTEAAEALAIAGNEFLDRQRRLQGGAHLIGVEGAQFAASLSDRLTMLEQLESAISSGWTYLAWPTLQLPMFDSYRDDEDFIAISTELKSRLESELAWFDANRDRELSLD